MGSALRQPLGREGMEVLDVVRDQGALFADRDLNEPLSLHPARSRSATATTSWPAWRSNTTIWGESCSSITALTQAEPARRPWRTYAQVRTRLLECDLSVDLVAVLTEVRDGRLHQPGRDLKVLGCPCDRSVIVADRGNDLPDIQTAPKQARAAGAALVRADRCGS